VTYAVDTSVVLRLLTGEPIEQAESAKQALERQPHAVHISALVVGESYFALRHHYHVPHELAVESLLALLTSDRVAAVGGVREALIAAHTTQHPGVMDRLILADANTEDCELLTFDKRLATLEGARLLR
jgi:predicted nucleic acid-binding protein